MSLQTDIIFVKAIKSDNALLHQLAAHDVYNTSIALPDEELDNAQVPYVIVSENEVVNDGTTKDDYEGWFDSVNITIEVAARTRKELGQMTDRIRRTIRQYFMNVTDDKEEYYMVPEDYQFSAKPVIYDPMKPCYWRELIYQCDVRNDSIEDDEE